MRLTTRVRMNWLIKREDLNVIYYMKLQRPVVCLSVYTPLFSTRLSDCNHIWHAYADWSGNRSNKKIDPPQVGPRGILGGQKNKGPGNVINCRENQ